MTKLESLYQEWLSLQPLKEEDQRRLDQKFMLEFNYNSNHIEGNTLTYGQTELLLLFGRVVGEAKMKDLEEMKAHNVCLKMVKEAALDKVHVLTEYFIRTLHQVMLREDYTVYRELPNGTQTSYVVHAGQYKTRPNSVITPTGERFEYASPEETPAMMADLLQWYHDAEAAGELSPIELAALFHYRYIRIHPFEDGNGRISRLLVNYILCRHGYPMIVIKTKDKKNYLNALGKADAKTGVIPVEGAIASLDQVKPFADYLSKVLADDMRTDIAIIKDKDESIWWFNGELVQFKNKNTIKILNALSENSRLSVRALSSMLGINKSAIQRQMKILTDNGYLVRVGGRSGHWHVVIVCTTPKGGTDNINGTVV